VGLNAPLPYLKNEAEKTLREMRETIKSARSFLKVQGVLQPPVKMNTSTVPPQYATMCFEFDVFDGDRFLDDVKKDRFGIFRGGVPVLKKGPSGNAAFFNGKNNFFQVSATGCKDINPGTNSFSISCNVLLMGEFWNSFMDKRGSTRHIYRMPGWALGSDRLGKRWRFTIEDTEEKYITLTAISKDMLYKWHNLVAVRNVEKKKVFLYVDGILQDEQDDPTENISNNRPFLCGKDCMVGGGFWGLLDQVTYWNHALSDKEIKWIQAREFRVQP
ncbi:MAG: hypothetical protein KAH38_03510, partial [Candidatus Hydrogenedentes bacterium]|nr:hypothetical protein [Candidatus Hydrogenedentota bacterium]